VGITPLTVFGSVMFGGELSVVLSELKLSVVLWELKLSVVLWDLKEEVVLVYLRASNCGRS
jgi:hypothetical protein